MTKNKSKNMIHRIIIAFILLVNATLAYSQATVSTVVSSGGSNRIYDYNYTTSITVNHTAYSDNNALVAKLTNNTTGATITTKPGSELYISITYTGNPWIYAATVSDISNLLDPSNLNVTGFTAAEITEFNNYGTLPDGVYSFCFEYWSSFSVAPLAKNTSLSSNNCVNNINILLANQYMKINGSITKPIAVREYSSLKSITATSLTCLSLVNSFYNVSLDFEIVGNNGFSVKAKNQRCSTATNTFDVTTTTPHVVTGIELSEYLDLARMDITSPNTNWTNDLINNDILPPGTYTVCVIGRSKARTNCQAISDPLLSCFTITVTPDPVHFTLVSAGPYQSVYDDLSSNLTSVFYTSQSSHPKANVVMKVRGNNGVTLSTKISGASPFAAVAANVPNFLSPSDFSYLFNRANVTVVGMDASAFLSTGKLPDGTYQICFEAYDDLSNLISDAFPQGCSQSFTIGNVSGNNTSLYEPPMLVLPRCNDSVKITFPQNIVFTWLNPSNFIMSKSAGLNQKYILKIVEVIPANRNPYDAFRGATTPFFFEKEITGTNYVYGPADPILTPGHVYAYSVFVAENPTQYRNNGRSDICWFSWGSTEQKDTVKKIFIPNKKPLNNKNQKIEIVIPVCGKSPINDNQIYVKWKESSDKIKTGELEKNVSKYLFEIKEYFPGATVKGKTLYTEYTTKTFVQNNVALLKLIDKRQYYFKVYKLVNNDRVAESEPCIFTYNFVAPKTKEAPKNYTIKGQIVYTCKGKDGEFVYNSGAITVREFYYIADKNNIDDYKYMFYKNPLNNGPLEEVNLKTDEDGFINTGLNIKELGVVQENYSYTSPYGTFKGALVHGIEVKLSNNYYEQISNKYITASNFVVDMGKLTTKVYTFDLTVNVRKGYKDAPEYEQNCEECLVVLNRQTSLPSGAPKFKVQGKSKAIKIGGPKYEFENSATTVKSKNKYGNDVTSVEFKNLICTKGQNHHYLITLKNNGFDKGIQVVAPYSDNKVVEAVYISDKLPKSKVKGQIFYTYKSSNTALPLKTTLLLQICYVVKKDGKNYVMNSFNSDKLATTSSPQNDIITEFNAKYPDNGKSIGYAYSNASGEFEFNVDNTDIYDGEKFKFSTVRSGEFGWNFNNSIYKCLRVVVNNNYYTSPDKDIFIEPLETVNVGKLTATVRAMNVQIICKSMKLENQAVVSGGPVSGLDISIKRKGPIAVYFPKNEGNIYKLNNVPDAYKKEGYISYGESDENGVCMLNDVVIPIGKDFEKMLFTAVSPAMKGEFNYFGINEVNTDGWKLMSKNPSFRADAVFNADYEVPTLTVEMNMIPIPPRVKGRVLNIAKSNTGLMWAKATLTYNITKTNWGSKSSSTNATYVLTDKDGYFEFNNVKNYTPDGTAGTTQSLSLKVYKSGYVYKGGFFTSKEYIKELGLLKQGEQRIIPEIYLRPAGTLTGTIKDESGNPVDCYVAALGSDLKEAETVLGAGWQFTTKYKIYIAPGENKKIVVWPKDLKYFIDTITVANINEGENEFNIVVKKRLHRFKFYVSTTKYTKVGGVLVEKTVNIANATVDIDGVKATTDENGFALMEFANTSTKNFTAKITGPAGDNYIQKNIKITNYETKSYATKTIVKLDQGTGLSGVVTLNGKPLKGAKVFIELGTTNTTNQSITDANGQYALSGIKLDVGNTALIKVTATNIKSTIIGASEKITFKSGNATKDFDLKEFNDFDVSEFHGFELEIVSLKKLSETEVEVDGFVKLKPQNGDFTIVDDGKLSFKKFKFTRGKSKNLQGMVVGIPSSDELVTEQIGLNLKYGKFINASFGSPEWLFGVPIKVVKQSEGSSIKGFASIVDNSFDFPGSYLSFGKTAFFFGTKGKTGPDKLIIEAFTAGKKNKISDNSYNITGGSGKPLKYKFLQFNAESNPENSSISVNSNGEPLLKMDTKISAHFDNITPSDLEINLGVFEMNHEKIFPLTGKQNISFKLEQWTVEVKNWQITTDKGGITANEGFVTAGVLNVPFTYFHMQNNLLKFDDFQLNELNLGNITKLQIGKGTTPIFGFDQATGTDKKPHWKMTLVGNGVNPAASFGGIEGLAPGKKVKIEVLSLLSNGEQLLSFGASTEPLILYDVVKFKPTTITSYENYFTMGGILDLNMPRFSSNMSGIIKVVKSGSGGKMEILPQQYEFEGKGFVKFKSLGTAEESQKIEPNKLTLFATIQEPGKTPLFKCKLEKEGLNGEAKITVLPNQSVPFGSNKLTKVAGSMNVVKGDWDYFRFEGDLQGFSGVSDGANHMAFTVYGDIKAEGQSIKMDNINTPFGNMELAYDYEKGQLIGHMDVDMDFSESLTVKGVANMVFDKNGFLVSVAAQVTAPVVNTFNAGILLGTYTNIPQNFLTDVVKYNYNKNVPCYIKEQGLTGFFITGGRELPLKVPQFSIDIPPGLAIVSVSCGATSGVEVQLAMNFKGGFKLDANLLVFAHAWASVGSITCTEASADATAELLVKGSYDAGKFAIDGCGSLVLAVKGKQSVPPFCSAPDIELGTTLGAKYEIHIGSDGFYQNVSFNMGAAATNCTAKLNCK